MIAAHVINLARAPERWTSLARIAAERELPIERTDAVDGRDPAALAASGADPAAGLSPGEIACFESHRRVWARIAAGDARFGLVLEDDVFIGRPILALLDAIEALPEDVAIVKLNAHPRGMLVRLAPVAAVAGRTLIRPVQRTSDSSAYVISRAFAARALDLHARYRLPLDVALFDPATCPGVAQLDPAVTIQQRYADFRFLDEGARATDIQDARPRGARPALAIAATRELERLWRRRIVPASQPLLNLGRPAAARLGFRRIRFRD